MSTDRMQAAMAHLQELGDHVAVPMKGGKSYVMVKDRIEVFRREFGDEYGIDTTVDYQNGFGNGAPVVAHTIITDKDDHIVASGWAVEFVGSTKLTDASPVEIAETSAIGRALACFGLAGGEYASFNEMEAHQRKQEFRDHETREPPRREPQQQARTGNGPPHRQTTDQSQWYVPTDHDAVWLQPEVESQKIIDQIEQIGTPHELGRYWSDLKPAIEIFKSDDLGKDLIAEIKAAFATRHNSVGAKR